MTQAHAVGASIVLAAIVVTGLSSAVFAARGGSIWTDRLRAGLMVFIGAEVAIGAVAFLAGSRPAEGLHLLYGLVALAALPLAASFAADAPPAARAWVQAVACGVLLLIAWRLASTG